MAKTLPIPEVLWIPQANMSLVAEIGSIRVVLRFVDQSWHYEVFGPGWDRKKDAPTTVTLLSSSDRELSTAIRSIYDDIRRLHRYNNDSPIFPADDGW